MQKKVTVMAFAAIAAVVVAMPVLAQQIYTDDEIGSLSSNTNASTAGLFGNDVDDFIDYHSYSGVLEEGAKWFGFITGRRIFNENDDQTGVADIGYATKFGDIYFGAWYRGNIARQTSGDTETHSINSTWDDTLGVLTRTMETTTYSTNKWLESANKFEFLIGVAGQGIKVGFFESYAVDQNPGTGTISVIDYLDGRKEYSGAIVDYKNSQGYIKPYIGWGSSFEVAGMNLKPYVDFGLTIYEDTQINNTENYTEVNGAKQGVTTNKDGRNNGYVQPNITVGAKLDLPKKEGSSIETQVGLKYGIGFNAYNNDYSASGFSGSVPGTVNWSGTDNVENLIDSTVTTTTTKMGIVENTNIDNAITLGYTVTGVPFEKFKLGFSCELPISFGSWTSNSYRRELTKKTTKFNWANPGSVTEKETIEYGYDGTTNTGWNSEGSNFGISLNLNLGASYVLIKDRFTINAGISATPFGYSRKEEKRIARSVDSIETEKTTLDDGSVTTNTKTVGLNNPTTDAILVEDTWEQWSATLGGGFVFYFSPKAALDLGITSALGGENTFNLLLDSVNVIFTFKF